VILRLEFDVDFRLLLVVLPRILLPQQPPFRFKVNADPWDCDFWQRRTIGILIATSTAKGGCVAQLQAQAQTQA
jgi:hypothetical protein